MTEDLKRVHGALPELVEQMQAGAVDRREFLRTATLLGLSASAAYALAGMEDPAGKPAEAATMDGGVVRISMRVPALENPATFSWVYDSNSVRQVCDYLTRTGYDNITRPWLLEKWEGLRLLLALADSPQVERRDMAVGALGQWIVASNRRFATPPAESAQEIRTLLQAPRPPGHEHLWRALAQILERA